MTFKWRERPFENIKRELSEIRATGYQEGYRGYSTQPLYSRNLTMHQINEYEDAERSGAFRRYREEKSNKY